MYLYFDRNGTLKEQIMVPLRQGDSNRKIYIYWDNEATISSCYCKYRLADGTETTTINADSLNTLAKVPYNQDRDLQYFRYDTYYNFIVFTIPDTVLSTEDSYAIVQSVLFSAWIVSDYEVSPLTLGKVAFAVEPSTLSVDVEKNINIAQWNELMTKFNDYTETDDLGNLLLKPSLSQKTSASYVVLTKTGGTTSALISGGTGSAIVPVVSGYNIIASVNVGAITNINQETGEISVISSTETVTITYSYEGSRNAFKFTIGTDYNGIYILTFSYLFIPVPIYSLADKQIYKFSGPGVQDFSTGSVTPMIYNMKRDGTDLYIWSGKTEYQLITGLVGTLAKVKLY